MSRFPDETTVIARRYLRKVPSFVWSGHVWERMVVRALQAVFAMLHAAAAPVYASASSTTSASDSDGTSAELAATADVFLHAWRVLTFGNSGAPDGAFRPEFVGTFGVAQVLLPAAEAPVQDQDLRLLLPYMLEAMEAEQKQLPGGLAASLWEDGTARGHRCRQR